MNKILTAAKKVSPTTLMQYYKSTKTFDRVFEKVNVLSIKDGQLLAELQVEEEHTNMFGGLHGGLSTTLVDVLSSYALSSKIGGTHVSVDIHMSFLKGARIGDNIVIDAQVVRTGKTLAFLECDITNKETGDILVKGSHTKFILTRG